MAARIGVPPGVIEHLMPIEIMNAFIISVRINSCG